MLNSPVYKVADTFIFVGVNSTKTRQFTVYSNEIVNFSRKNAMILPVPYPSSVKFHDLSGYNNFFSDCSDCFRTVYDPSMKPITKSRSFNSSDEKRLSVFSVGSFNASIAESLDDIKRIDESVFKISSNIEEYLCKNYNNSFGFIVCCLKDGDVKYHPFAYSNDISNGSVFVPTRHFHLDEKRKVKEIYSFRTGEVKYVLDNEDEDGIYQVLGKSDKEEYSKQIFNMMRHSNGFKKEHDDTEGDWDHEIYLYNVSPNFDFLNIKNSDYIYEWNGDNKINVEKLDGFELDTSCSQFTKSVVRGTKRNYDVILSV